MQNRIHTDSKINYSHLSFFQVHCCLSHCLFFDNIEQSRHLPVPSPLDCQKHPSDCKHGFLFIISLQDKQDTSDSLHIPPSSLSDTQVQSIVSIHGFLFLMLQSGHGNTGGLFEDSILGFPDGYVDSSSVGWLEG